MGDVRKAATEAMKTIDRLLTIRGITGVRLDGVDAETESALAKATGLLEANQMDKLQGQLSELFNADGWVTMRGTHVLIGDAGTVKFGPSRLRGFKYRQYYENHTVAHGTSRAGRASYKDPKTCGKSYIAQALSHQGFDGLPKIVSKKEFNEARKKSSFVAQRIYCGSTKAVVDAYQQQFYSGSFYVDCKDGGAQYGKGMYVSADYTGTLSSGIKMEMDHYKDLGRGKGARFSKTETMTLDPSAKIVEYGDVRGAYIRSCTESLGKPNAAVSRALDQVTKAAHACDDRPGWMISSGMSASSTKKAALADAYKVLKREARKQYGADGERVVNEAINRAKEAASAKEFGHDGIDFGVLAAECGFDAINAKGHGKSGSYTVVLNRTKLLVEGDPMHKSGGRTDAAEPDYSKAVFKYNANGVLEGWLNGKKLGELYGMGDMLDEPKEESTGMREDSQFRADDWVTIHGTHVFIDGSGRITKGPSVLTGGTVGDLSKKKKTTATMTTGQKVTVKGVEYEKMKSGKLKYKTPDSDTKLSHRYLSAEDLDKKIAKAGGIDRKSTSEMKTGDKIKVKGVEFEKTATGTLKYTDPHGKVRYKKPEDVDSMILKEAGKAGTPAPATAKPAAPAATPARPAGTGTRTAKDMPTGTSVTIGAITYTKGADGDYKYADPRDGHERTVSPLKMDRVMGALGMDASSFKEPGSKSAKDMAKGSKVTMGGVTFEKTATGTFKYTDPHGKVRYVKPEEMEKRMEKAKKKGTLGDVTDAEAGDATKAATTAAAPAPEKKAPAAPAGEKKPEGGATGEKTGAREKTGAGVEYEKRDQNDYKTLMHRDKHEEEYAKSPEGLKKKKAVEDYARRHGLPSDFVEKAIEKAFASGVLKMRVGGDTLHKIIATNRFKNQFEVKGATGGYSDPKARKGIFDIKSGRGEASHGLFGTDATTKGSEAEKYGYLGIDDDKSDFEGGGTSHYGNVIVKFKKDRVMDRLTYTSADSLGPGSWGGCIGGKATKPSIYGLYHTSDRDLAAYEKVYKMDISKQKVDPRKMATTYFELQYHGDTTLDDVGEICFRDRRDDTLSPAERKNLESRGIKITYANEALSDPSLPF